MTGGVWHLVRMSWETVATVLVAVAGLAATVLTAAQARKHEERQADKRHRRERAERVRQDRLSVCADALGHAIDQERRLDAVWESDGEQRYRLSPRPAGAPLTLASMDDITVRMRLLADNDVEAAWGAFVRAWEGLELYITVDFVPPGEEPPANVIQPLRDAIEALKVGCRRSLERDEHSLT